MAKVTLSSILTSNAGALNRASDSLADTFERLSSGLRINSAKDDAAGLALSDKLDSDSRVYAKALLNTSDSISLFNMAEAAIDEQVNILTNLLELAEQASSSAYGDTQRETLDEEAQALIDEYNRIAGTTEYNDKQLIDGSLSSLRTQTGISSTDNITSDVTAGFDETIANGTFSGLVTTISSDINNSRDLVADFNNDGKQDILKVNATQGTILLGDGDGTFTESGTFATGSAVTYAAIGDINGDGEADVVYESAYASSIFYRLGDGSGSFGSAVTLTTAQATTEGVEIADVDGDGDNDILAASSDVGSVLNVFINNGNGSFASALSYSIDGFNTSIEDVAVGDFDNDESLDVIIGNSGGNYAYILQNDGAGAFTLASTYAASGSATALNIAVGDVDGDGNDDFIVGDNVDGVTTVVQSLGDLVMFDNLVVEIGAANYQNFADFDNDGNLDILFQDTDGDYWVRLGNGDTTFQSGSELSIGNASGVIADFNNDGILDVGVARGDIAVTFGQGDIINSFTITDGEIDLTTVESALTSFNKLTDYLSSAQLYQGQLGGELSRLEFAARDITSKRDLFADAASTIRDIDAAQEVAELVRKQVLQDSASAMMAAGKLQADIVASLYGSL